MPTKTNKFIIAASAFAMILLAGVAPADACMPNPWPPIGPCEGYDGPYEPSLGDCCCCDGRMVPGVPGADCPGIPCHDCFWPHQGPRAGDPR